MKVLLFTDVHANEDNLRRIVEKSKDCDVMACCGDLSIFGSGLKKSLRILRKSGKKLFIIHGNHEMISELKDECNGKNVIFMHKKSVDIGDITIAAYGGGGFSERDERLDAWARKVKSKVNKKLLFLAHAPPYNTNLDNLPEIGHRGSKSIMDAIKILKPDVFASGHFHETFLKKDKIGGTLLVNPGDRGLIVNVQ